MLTTTSTDTSTITTPPSASKQRRGFCAMSPEAQRKIASQGGKAAHANGKAHQWTTEAARAAGKAGGAACFAKHGSEHLATIGRQGGATVSKDREHMAQIGRKGGEAVSIDREHMQELGRRGGVAKGKRAGKADGQ